MDHYFDEGCVCKACGIKRNETIQQILRGVIVKDRIVHIEAKSELLQKRFERVNKINNMISKLPVKSRGKDFRRDMKIIVSKK